MKQKAILVSNLDKIHTTKLGEERIKKNLSLDTSNIVLWCKQIITDSKSSVARRGKNWYIAIDNWIITINASSYTIITAHKMK